MAAPMPVCGNAERNEVAAAADLHRPIAPARLFDTAEATAWQPPSIMLARCGGDFIQTSRAQASVLQPTATFSAMAPCGPR